MKQYIPAVVFVITIAAFLTVSRFSHQSASRTVAQTASIQGQLTAKQKAIARQLKAKTNLDIKAPQTGSAPISPAAAAEIAAAHAQLDSAVTQAQDQTTAATAASDSHVLDLYMPAGLSIILLIAALYMILSRKFDADALKWAFGTVGTIIGYWLKAS